MSCCINATNIVALQESMTDVVSAIQKALGKEDDFSRHSIESTLSMCACCMYTWMCTHMCTDVCMCSGMIENANRSPVSNCVLCSHPEFGVIRVVTRCVYATEFEFCGARPCLRNSKSFWQRRGFLPEFHWIYFECNSERKTGTWPCLRNSKGFGQRRCSLPKFHWVYFEFNSGSKYVSTCTLHVYVCVRAYVFTKMSSCIQAWLKLQTGRR